MNDVPCRTFVSVDEAIAILLKRIDGPVEYRVSPDEYLSSEDQEQLDSIEYSLHEDFEEEHDELLEALGNAKKSQVPEKIEHAREALRQYKESKRLAYTYRCHLEDELSKGDKSALRVTGSGSSYGKPWITLISLYEWAVKKHIPTDYMLSLNASNKTQESTQADDKPWSVAQEGDPPERYSWFRAARYFARQHIRKSPTPSTKKEILAKKVYDSLKSVGVYKRGGKEPPCPGTILKAFTKITF